MPYKPWKALAYAVLIWLVGFVWGSVVFMTPALKGVRPIPYVSANPAISFPILAVWLLLAYLLSKNYLKATRERAAEGLKLGVVFSLTNFALDLVALVVLLGAGAVYFVSLTVWLGYAMLLVVPWATGLSLQKAL